MREAVDIQQRSYRFLRWLKDLPRQKAPFPPFAHTTETDDEFIRKWLERGIRAAPPDCRPATEKRPYIDRYMNFFSSYLLTSFAENPEGSFRVVPTNGCMCTWCQRIEQLPRLQTKKPTSRDKRQAHRLKEDVVLTLLGEARKPQRMKAVERVLADDELSVAAAYCAYGAELLNRCEGISQGPAVLVLWRQFAWKKSGSPKPGFELKVADILQAERLIFTRLIQTE